MGSLFKHVDFSDQYLGQACAQVTSYYSLPLSAGSWDQMDFSNDKQQDNELQDVLFRMNQTETKQ